MFIGVHGMDVGTGFTTPNLMESETNRALVERAAGWSCGRLHQVGGRRAQRIAALSDASVLVTDTGLSAQASGVLSDRVGELVLVDVADDAPSTASRDV